jgi:TPR repeat protein
VRHKTLNKVENGLNWLQGKGSVSAMNNLGNIYRSGIGTETSPHLALKYYTMAANKGDTGAMANLVSLYLNIQGVE